MVYAAYPDKETIGQETLTSLKAVIENSNPYKQDTDIVTPLTEFILTACPGKHSIRKYTSDCDKETDCRHRAPTSDQGSQYQYLGHIITLSI